MNLLVSLQREFPLLLDILRLSFWLVIIAAVFVPLERLFALHPSQLMRRQTGVDLLYYFINSLVPAVIMAVPLSMVAMASQRLLPAGFHAAVQALPFWLNVLIGMVLADIGGYWGHRMSHQIPFLWRFHAVHHSAEHMDFLVNTRGHPLDMVVTRISSLIPITFLGLGSGGDRSTWVAVVATVIGVLVAFFVHANLQWRFGWLEKVFSTPIFHHWHHGDADLPNRNFAATFAFTDRLFGTYFVPGHWPAKYGIKGKMAETLGGQLIQPIAALFKNSAKRFVRKHT